MRSVCLIPARSGSKGLPNKNMLFLDGQPMIFHTIDAAIESGCFNKEDIYVSTDSEVYKEICETKGIKVLLRPEELSTDFTTSYEVNEHFLREFDDDQVFVLLQVTSPLRNGKNIREAMKLYNQGGSENVVSFSKVEKSPKFFTELDKDGFAKDILGVDKGYRRQNDKKELYAPNGAIYITRKAVYLKNKSYFTEKTKAYIMKKEDSIDVDDRLDFTSVIGRVYFDYVLREKRNKQFYKNHYLKFNHYRINDNLIIGDSRLLNFSLSCFDNISVGGVTIATILENIDIILSKKVDKVILSAGVNDLIAGYNISEITENLNKIVEFLLKNNVKIYLTTIAYTLFRDSVSNDDIIELNSIIKEIANDNELILINVNKELSETNMLKYKYTSDGLHFNELGQKIFNNNILEYIQY